jgi:hypothetical protein
VAIEGELIVRLNCSGRRVRQVTVRSTRPLVAARLLAGRTAAAAAALVPKLFSLCGAAQGAAALTALAAAGASSLPTNAAGRDRAVMLEALQDGLWHLLIDWPNAMGCAPCATPVAAARFQIAAATRAADGTPQMTDAGAMRDLGARIAAISAQSIFGMPPAAWREQADVASLQAWCARGDTLPAVMLGDVLAHAPMLCRSATPLMPAPGRDTLLCVILPALRDDPAFCRAPTWEGVPVETGALARMRDDPLVAAMRQQFGNAVVTRIVARLAELARLTMELTDADAAAGMAPRIQSISGGDGEGLAAVETARGLLLHRASVRDERVVDYAIVAPTEWNFHSDGALARGLDGLEVDDEPQLLRAARLAVHALDPCVAFRVEAGHA